MSCFSRSVNGTSSISRYIFGAWIKQNKIWFGTFFFFLENRAFLAKNVFFNTKRFLCHGPNIMFIIYGFGGATIFG